MKINAYLLVIVLVVAGYNSTYAQEKDGIGTEVISVVKPYTPTISDAFKVKEVPVVEEEETAKKALIQYTIFSFPVASTFVPAKGNAVQADKAAPEKLFENFARLGFGNYGTVLADVYLTHDFDSHNFINAAINHLSSAGGIKGIDIPDSYLKSGFDVTYGSKKQTYSWDAKLGYHVQKQHWYGVDFGPNSQIDWTGIPKDQFSKAQTFQHIDLGTNLRFADYMLKQVGVEYSRFWDAYNSSEIQFKVRPDIVFTQSNKEIKTAVLLDHVSGSFSKDYENLSLSSYNSTSIGVQPSFAMQQDDWSFSLGTALFYNSTTQATGSKFFFYPKVAASLKVVGDLMVFYTGIDGDLQQNTYRSFAQANPFVSPTLLIAPTNKQFDLYAGLKGKLASYLSYDVKAALKQENNKALFRSNYLKQYAAENEVYTFGNSFEVVYDNVKTIQVAGGLRSDLSKDIAVGVQATVSKYVLSTQAYAWNLPQIELQANAEVDFLPKWSAGTALFFVGERKDFQVNQMVLPLVAVDYTRTLKSYVDANFALNYKHNARWGAFLKLNNVLNQNYERWLNYSVQGFQVLAGASYKFDF
jgi:hypothetical protein